MALLQGNRGKEGDTGKKRDGGGGGLRARGVCVNFEEGKKGPGWEGGGLIGQCVNDLGFG